MTTEYEVRHIAGRYGYVQVTPTVEERARGMNEAFVVLDLSVKEDDGFYKFASPTLVSRNAAVRRAQEFARYDKEGGENLNRQAIAEWAAQLTA